MEENRISCIIVDDELHARKLLRKYISRSDVLQLAGEFDSASAALKGIAVLQPELIFLDIQMPGQTGIDLLEQLEHPEQYIIVFTTAYDQYALKAFDKSAIDYLLKPFDEERFDLAIEKVKRISQSLRYPRNNELGKIEKLLMALRSQRKATGSYLEKITCKTGNKLTILQPEDVLYIEACGNYTQAHTTGKAYLLDISISDILTQLNPDIFVRIHRSAIVNIRSIVAIEHHFNGEYRIELHNKASLKVSRSYKDDFNRIMGIF